ncbi:MAG: spore cortex biosynthesis protein YabQ [Clostridia bacterium]|nr:spore cortex biosynthesis protein YabQ [Clostridia bacterium]
MRINSNADLITFLLSIIVGIGMAVIYDLFKSMRKAFKFSVVSIVFQDIIYSVIAAIITFTLLFIRVYGEIRWFVLFAELFGAVLERKIISKVLVKSIYKILKQIYKVFICLKRLFERLSIKFYYFIDKTKEKIIKKS